ncbi:MAG: hypothetical protein QXX12_05955 [Nanopusillaceae archaeon]
MDNVYLDYVNKHLYKLKKYMDADEFMTSSNGIKLSCGELLDIKKKLTLKYVDFMSKTLSNWRYSDVYGILMFSMVLSIMDCYVETLKYIDMAVEQLSCSEYKTELQK